jgi:inorganic triphosphatase YgiF
MPPSEVELKFSLSAADAERLRRHPIWAPDAQAPAAEQLISVYYDTPDRRLQAKSLTLRIRTVGERFVQTVKSAEGPGLLGRGEWETNLASDTPNLDAALLTPLAKALDEDEFAQLAPVFLTHVSRLSRIVHHAGAEIEASLDEGEIEADDGRTAALSELELELKSGAPSALFSLAEALGGDDPLRLSLVSKAEAGYRLAERHARVAVKAQAPRLGEAKTAAEAFQRIGRACLHQLNANESGILAARAPEAVHQMRVALRRLRAALATFRHVAADDGREAIKAELKWISGELNDARNLDVLILETYRPYAEALADPSEQPSVEVLGRALTAAQTRAYDRAAAAVASARYRRLVLQTAAWVEAGPWLSEAAADTEARDRPVEIFAAEALQRRFKAMRKTARDLEGADAPARHAFRIAAKKMRYTAELLADLYGDAKAAKRRDRFVAALKVLQDRLGVLNDMATAEATVMLALSPKDQPPAPPQVGFAAGVMVGRRLAAEGDLLKETLAAADDFVHATPFW